MVVLAKTSNKLIRIRGFHIDYLGHAQSEGTDDQTGRWYEYEFVGQHRAEFTLARDAESDVVHLRVTLPASLEPRVETAVAIFSHFRVSRS